MSQKSHSDEVLPFDNSDVVNGVGKIERIVALANHTDEDGVTRSGRCNWCGYDRATLVTHTEVASWSLTCRQCEKVVGGEV